MSTFYRDAVTKAKAERAERMREEEAELEARKELARLRATNLLDAHYRGTRVMEAGEVTKAHQLAGRDYQKPKPEPHPTILGGGGYPLAQIRAMKEPLLVVKHYEEMEGPVGVFLRSLREIRKDQEAFYRGLVEGLEALEKVCGAMEVFFIAAQKDGGAQ